jgi:MFS family permease
MKEYLQVLKNRNFFLLWAGQGVSEIGSGISFIALSLLITDLTGSASAVGLLFIVLTIPSVAVGPWAGVLVDRWNKKLIIILADVIRGVLGICMALTTDLVWLYALALGMGLVSVFFSPAIKTAIPRIVAKEELLTANALSSATYYMSRLAGPALGGVLIAVFGLQSAFIVNGISYLVSALSEAWIAIPASKQEQSSDKGSFAREFRDGWEYIRNNVAVKFVIIFFAITSLPPMGAFGLLTVVLLRDVFQYSPEVYGLLMTINGAGLVLGTFWMGKWGRQFRELQLIVWGVAVLGLAYLGLSQGSLFLLAAGMLFTSGFTSTVVNIAYGTYLQLAVDDDKRGRVFSLDIAIGNVVGLVAMGSTGFMADTWGTIFVVALGGCMLFAVAFTATRLSVYRRSLAAMDIRRAA